MICQRKSSGSTLRRFQQYFGKIGWVLTSHFSYFKGTINFARNSFLQKESRVHFFKPQDSYEKWKCFLLPTHTWWWWMYTHIPVCDATNYWYYSIAVQYFSTYRKWSQKWSSHPPVHWWAVLCTFQSLKTRHWWELLECTWICSGTLCQLHRKLLQLNFECKRVPCCWPLILWTTFQTQSVPGRRWHQIASLFYL